MKGCKWCSCTSRLSAVSFAIALGLVTGLGMMFFAWLVHYWGYGNLIVAQWAEIFPGYAASMKGGLIGAGWGFVEGFVFGLIFAWIYNLCLCCCKSMCGCCRPEEERKSGKKQM